jgi:hypothetical protein
MSNVYQEHMDKRIREIHERMIEFKIAKKKQMQKSQ